MGQIVYGVVSLRAVDLGGRAKLDIGIVHILDELGEARRSQDILKLPANLVREGEFAIAIGTCPAPSRDTIAELAVQTASIRVIDRAMALLDISSLVQDQNAQVAVLAQL